MTFPACCLQFVKEHSNGKSANRPLKQRARTSDHIYHEPGRVARTRMAGSDRERQRRVAAAGTSVGR